MLGGRTVRAAMFRLRVALFVVSIVGVLPTMLNADPIIIGPWNQFSFDAVGVQARGCPPPGGPPCSPLGVNSVFIGEPSWTLSNSEPVTFRITDGFTSGDAFQVFDSGALILSTPMVPVGNTCGNVPDFCFISPAISHAATLLEPGSHSITITPIAVQNLGSAFFQVVVPEPPTLLTGGVLGIALLAYTVRSRRHAAGGKTA